MTVPSITSRVTYAGDGGSVAFPVSFYFLANADLVVLLVDADGISTTQVLNTDYTLTGAGVEAGGTVTMLTAPPSGYTLIIYRDPAVTQLTDYAPNDPFPAETHERALDRLTMISQRNRELVTRAIRLSDSDTSGASTDLPVPTARRALIWAADGLSIINSGSDPDAVAVSAQASSDAAAASAASALISENNAAASYDDFDDRYLGAKAAEPTLDNDGDALQQGALYFNTTTMRLRLYDGAAWQDTATSSPASFSSNVYNGTGAQTDFTLSSTPASVDSVFVFISGVAQRPTTDYSISGTTLTFVAAPPLGTNNVLAFVASTVAAGTPDNASVSTAKLQDGALSADVTGRAKMADGFNTTAKYADDSVTYAKLQNLTTNGLVLGRNTGGTGNAEELSLTQILDFIGSAAQGDILYRAAAGWARLGAGTSGQFLKTMGPAANPVWSDVSTGGMTLLGTLTTTSGTTQTLSGLTFTDYKSLYIVITGVSFTTAAAMTLGGVTFCANTGLASGVVDGYSILDLTNGIFNTTSEGSSLRTDIGNTSYSNATTSIVFAGGTFDAGSIKVYGVK